MRTTKLLAAPRPYRAVFLGILGLSVFGSAWSAGPVTVVIVLVGMTMLATKVVFPAAREWLGLGLWIDGEDLVVGNRDGMYRVERDGMRMAAVERLVRPGPMGVQLDPTIVAKSRHLTVYPRGDHEALNVDAIGNMSARRFRRTIASLQSALDMKIEGGFAG